MKHTKKSLLCLSLLVLAAGTMDADEPTVARRGLAEAHRESNVALRQRLERMAESVRQLQQVGRLDLAQAVAEGMESVAQELASRQRRASQQELAPSEPSEQAELTQLREQVRQLREEVNSLRPPLDRERRDATERLGKVDLEGDWELTLPAGFVYETRIANLGEGIYEVGVPGNLAGLYRRQGHKLTVKEPREPRLTEFVWELRSNDLMLLVKAPPVAKVGSDYRGALLRRKQSAVSAPNKPQSINVVFGRDPGKGNYDGVVGRPRDTWNLLDVGQTSLKQLRNHKGRATTVNLKVSENDGEWGIEGQDGVYHAYIYHNCRCVDLEAVFSGLAPGRYEIYVYAHGDAPDQNAEIELAVGAEVYGQKSTLNDGSWDYRSRKFAEGVQYVRFEFAVEQNSQPVKVTSRRAGSVYSMFNAIQIVPLTK